MDVKRLRQNVKAIEKRITNAAVKAGRKPEEVTMVAVTKQVTSEVIAALSELGVRHIGENRVQDARDKKEALQLAGKLEWHLIGHLQRNKVRDAVAMFDCIHSLDSVSLTEEVSKRTQRELPVLLEVNVSGELSKGGFTPADLERSIEALLALPQLRICGLMTMAPQTDNMDVCRFCFRTLRELAERLRAKYSGNLSLPHLSMGMSQDFEVAIGEGATLVRIGTALYAEVF